MSRSPYPAWWCDTVTIFNRYKDPQTDIIRWYRTVLHGCFWKDTGVRVVVGDTQINTDTVVCRIPKSSKFLESYDWQANPGNGYFTLQHGDILIKGDINFEIDEYSVDKKSTDLMKMYRYHHCITVDRWGINTGDGRGIPHYRVSGA